MTTEPLVLGFDTSAAHCAAALLLGDRIIATCLEPMTRGQAERLMGLLEDLLTEGGVTWRDLSAIGVGVGPGNFTGIRIGVSAARGLALGLEIPAVGVTGFEARLTPGALAAIPAPRNHIYIQPQGGTPRLLPRAEAEDYAAATGVSLDPQASPARLAEAIARVAAVRFSTETEPPAPLYLRAADAAPSRDVPPPLIDD